MNEKTFNFVALIKGPKGARPAVGDAVPQLAQPGKVIWELVFDDIVTRHQASVDEFGIPLFPFAGEDPVADAYIQALDLAVYLRQVIESRNYAQVEKKAGDIRAGLDRKARSKPLGRKASKLRKRPGR